MDIEVFPYRVLGSDTTEALLNDLESLEDVKRTVIHGPRFQKVKQLYLQNTGNVESSTSKGKM